jgi:aspartyl/asparaginyl beta-hydroxylase (cupin superfamily)
MQNRERVLLDPEADERLQRDGFVVLDLLSSSEAADLRARYGELSGWSGSGFESELSLDDPDRRRLVNRVLGDAADRAVSARFDGYTPFLHNFLVKFPGGDSDLYIHRDWMYVDEPQGHRTYVAWIALEDILGHNGQLRVLRGSHRLDSMLRGTDLIAPWLSHGDVIDERFLSVPVRAGECVVFDNALVHASFPNHTDRPRVAAAVGMRPTSAQLVHFRRHDELTADRYDVDDDFFCTHTPHGLIAAPPDLPVAERVPVGTTELSAAELASALDAGVLAKLDRARHLVADGQRLAAGAARTGADRVRALTARDGARSTNGAHRPEREPGALKRLLSPGAAGTARAGADTADQSTKERLKAQIDDLPTKAAIAVLGLNEAGINKFGPDTPAVWDPDVFPWSSRIEAGWADIRAEVDALLEGPSEIPHIEDVTGGIPQGNIGPWRSFVLMHQGRWMDWNCERCPRTTELVRSIPGLTMAGFSVLEPGTHITEHRGPNKGALRYQLGVIVPGAPGDCRIRVGDEMVVWREGEGVAFDFTVPHEAWNDSDGIRVLLMLEFVTPGLPWYLAGPNRWAQHAMSWFPTTRDMTRRLRQLEPTLQRPAVDA